MIQANELRFGNIVYFSNYEPVHQSQIRRIGWNDLEQLSLDEHADRYSPIPLTPEILEKCGFKQLPHFTVQNNWYLEIGRDRVISIACVGTPNEMVFINEEVPPEVKNMIVVRNYDYDGYTYLHDIQNIYYDFTKQQLPVSL